MIRPLKVFTSGFTDSRHQINVRYHTSKLLNQPPSPHPMIRDRKFLAKMKNTFFSNDDPRKKRFHVGVHRFSATSPRTLTYVKAPRGHPLPPSNDKGTEKGNVRFFQKRIFAIKKNRTTAKIKNQKTFHFFTYHCIGGKGDVPEGYACCYIEKSDVKLVFVRNNRLTPLGSSI